tara:strand:+ start:5843 stop:6181 length:339 start_codon:yes stop_codon:yes gene_type:complete
MAVQYHNNYIDTTNFSDVTTRIALTSGNTLTYTVPGLATNNMQAIFTLTDDATLFVGYNKTATVPALNTVTSDQFIELMKDGFKRFVRGGDVLSFVTPDPMVYVGISLRALP